MGNTGDMPNNSDDNRRKPEKKMAVDSDPVLTLQPRRHPLIPVASGWPTILRAFPTRTLGDPRTPAEPSRPIRPLPHIEGTPHRHPRLVAIQPGKEEQTPPDDRNHGGKRPPTTRRGKGTDLKKVSGYGIPR